MKLEKLELMSFVTKHQDKRDEIRGGLLKAFESSTRPTHIGPC